MTSISSGSKQVEAAHIDYERASPIGSDLEPTTTIRRRREAPELVRDLTSAERMELEKRLVRKIDFRLLPMVVLMVCLVFTAHLGSRMLTSCSTS